MSDDGGRHVAEDVLGLREEKKDRTRSQLLEAALELVRVRGFAETTIADIAAVVGVSPRTVLRYFPTKEDVIVSWVHDGMTILREELKARLPAERPAAALLASARVMLATYDQKSRFLLAIEDAIRSDTNVSARKEQMIADLADEVREILAAPGATEPLSRVVAEALAGTVFALVRATIGGWVRARAAVSIISLFDEAADAIRLAHEGVVD